MLFNSFEFFIFLPVVFCLYWFVFKRSIKAQNVLLLIASYVFYGWWDWRFLSLILFSTLVDYAVGLKLGASEKKGVRKGLLVISLLVNLGLLGVFKYYNFFVESWIDAWGAVGIPMNATTLNIILPVGISFYTFQTLSYSIDVYRNKLQPTRNFIAFAAFVSFFPQLVAGPIERASNLLPQFFKDRSFTYDQGVTGMRMILYGLFKKVVIADNCAPYVDDIFLNYSEYSSPVLVLGAVLFAVQIYGDFSGYSDIAIGTARLFGFNLMTNFRYPYFSRNIGEFWRRWHISLSTWFRDYLYIPLGGSRGNTYQQLRNVLIIFVVSGFWHGANWTFIAWGGLHALFFIPLLFFGRNRKYLNAVAEDRIFPHFKEALAILGTFAMVTFAWIFFRADSITHAFDYIRSIVISEDYTSLSTKTTYLINIKPLFLLLIFFMIIEWFSREREQFVGQFLQQRSVLRYAMYFVLMLFIILSFNNEATSFIYFQF
ncbi:MBOAT family O-acyltransferase [Constantimarinum furrinae]|uniref:Putative poly(Beta-D-mannuronate) O-acetylase n=1 Tax=Constantimarinum furrinae TaxID=2562285 RepID=A0A7G8PQT2_9FLAO|nr:MBOAT family protein [Constantimarinum furrinae]QNJ96698.1 putative poly(Beta-D-mannuronate) O-acetylase [Constantimarinum furrinae]